MSIYLRTVRTTRYLRQMHLYVSKKKVKMLREAVLMLHHQPLTKEPVLSIKIPFFPVNISKKKQDTSNLF